MFRRLQILSAILVFFGASELTKARAGSLFGEAGAGASVPLVFGTVVNWSNTSTVLFTCANTCVNGFVILHIVPRTTVGTQPLSYSIAVSGGTALTGSTTVINGLLPMASSFTAVGGPGQTLTVTPLTTTSGTMVFDVVGYFL